MNIHLIKTFAAVAAFALCVPMNSLAQSDSTNTVRLAGVPIVKLRNQERETPQVNNNTTVVQNVTQQIGGADRISSSGPHLNAQYDGAYGTCGAANSPGSAGWALACGSRACQSFGYVGGYASEVDWPNVGLVCFK